MEREERKMLLALIRRAIEPDTSDEELGEILETLGRHVPHPSIGELIFHHTPELSPEEVLDEALSYRPIQLGDEK